MAELPKESIPDPPKDDLGQGHGTGESVAELVGQIESLRKICGLGPIQEAESDLLRRFADSGFAAISERLVLETKDKQDARLIRSSDYKVQVGAFQYQTRWATYKLLLIITLVCVFVSLLVYWCPDDTKGAVIDRIVTGLVGAIGFFAGKKVIEPKLDRPAGKDKRRKEVKDVDNQN